jgi:Na+/H+ antiporter NhaC
VDYIMPPMPGPLAGIAGSGSFFSAMTHSVTSVLVPWNTCGMTQATVLGVPTLTYLPYCFFNLISPLMTILVAALGWKIPRRKQEINTKV